MGKGKLNAPLFAGVELGGTKCVCILASAPDGIVDRVLIATTIPEDTLGAIEAVLSRWRTGHIIAGLGVASFGPIELDARSEYFGFITTTPKPHWSGTDVARRLARAADAPMAFDTDVNGAALAEQRWGAGAGLDDLAYVTVGTGVGVGLIVNGQRVHRHGHPELGHIRIARLAGDSWPGACPYHGDCVEGLASGHAIAARLDGRTLESLGPDDLLWDGVAWALAQLCHTIACATAPSRILFGGGVMKGQSHLLARVQTLLQASLAGYLALPDDYLQPARLGDLAGPLGAIALGMQAVQPSAGAQ
jgi:fructokinase